MIISEKSQNLNLKFFNHLIIISPWILTEYSFFQKNHKIHGDLGRKFVDTITLVNNQVNFVVFLLW